MDDEMVATDDDGLLPGDGAARFDEALVGEPVGWQRPDPTGLAGVDSALDQLDQLGRLPISEHVAIYETVHRQLQDSLADLDGH